MFPRIRLRCSGAVKKPARQMSISWGRVRLLGRSKRCHPGRQEPGPAEGEESKMRFLVMVKGNEDSESGRLPTEQELSAMTKFNEELAKAGVMLAGEGLHPSSKGVRVRFSGGKRTVIDGPFAETKELIAGFWIWQVKSKEEAIEWLKRAPFDGGTE